MDIWQLSPLSCEAPVKYERDWKDLIYRYIKISLKGEINSLLRRDAVWRLIWVNNGSDNGLLPGGTKPLHEPMLAYNQQGPVNFIWGQFRKTYLSHQLLKLAWNLLLTIFYSNLQWAYELTNGVLVVAPSRKESVHWSHGISSWTGKNSGSFEWLSLTIRIRWM